jgi:hypothetical protein
MAQKVFIELVRAMKLGNCVKPMQGFLSDDNGTAQFA